VTPPETTIDDLLAEIQPRTAVARVLLRQDLVEQHARLDAALNAAMLADQHENRDPVGPRLARELAEFEASIDAAKREFHFKAIGKRKWADLMAKHPPTKEQVKAHGRIDHNPATFPIAAIAASCTAPAMTTEQVAALEDGLNQTQFDQLWAACLDANVGGGSDPKSLTAGLILRTSGQSASTAVLEGLLAASSSDE